MIIRSSREAINDYYDSSIISQSKLKLLTKGVRAYNRAQTEQESELFFEEKTHLIIGTGVDTVLTNESQVFEEMHFVSTLETKPSPQMMSVIQQVYDMNRRVFNSTVPRFEQLEQDIVTACDSHKYYMKMIVANRTAKILKEGAEYWKELVASDGKVILSLDEYSTIQVTSQSLKTNLVTRWLFDKQYLPSHMDIYFQPVIFFSYLDCEFKMLPDIIKVDHMAKTIQVMDVKTSGSYTISFPSSVRKYRYDFQAAFYSIGVFKWIRNEMPELSDYMVVNPAFVVETTLPGEQGNPLIYTTTDELIQIALEGRQVSYEGVQLSRIQGIDTIIHRYKWHLENGFEFDKEVMDYQGNLPLSWEGVL